MRDSAEEETPTTKLIEVFAREWKSVQLRGGRPGRGNRRARRRPHGSAMFWGNDHSGMIEEAFRSIRDSEALPRR
jgi:hypothetical protein